jgi:hypothetical protein
MYNIGIMKDSADTKRINQRTSSDMMRVQGLGQGFNFSRREFAVSAYSSGCLPVFLINKADNEKTKKI